LLSISELHHANDPRRNVPPPRPLTFPPLEQFRCAVFPHAPWNVALLIGFAEVVGALSYLIPFCFELLAQFDQLLTFLR
jgi:uncharacterized membrane protein